MTSMANTANTATATQTPPKSCNCQAALGSPACTGKCAKQETLKVVPPTGCRALLDHLNAEVLPKLTRLTYNRAVVWHKALQTMMDCGLKPGTSVQYVSQCLEAWIIAQKQPPKE